MEETAVLIARSQAGDKHAREVLIEGNLGLVRHIVRRFLGRGTDQEDLFQIGTIGLMRAIDHFDTGMNLCFSTYAVPVIMGEIRCFLRDDGMVKVSRSIKENSVKLARERERLAAENGREPSLEELAKAAGLSREDAIMALEAGGCVDSLENCQEGEDGSMQPLLDRISAVEGEGPVCASLTAGEGDREKDRLLDHLLLQQLLEELPAEDRKLLWLRFFRDWSQTEVAQALGISQVQVSRREKKILRKLQERAEC